MSREKDGREPGKFFVMSSVLGSIAEQEGKKEVCLSYGISKCAANFFIRRAHCEHEDLVCVALHPGYVFPSPPLLSPRIRVLMVLNKRWVQTAMGQGFADSLGFNGSPPLTVGESVKRLLEQVSSYLSFQLR